MHGKLIFLVAVLLGSMAGGGQQAVAQTAGTAPEASVDSSFVQELRGWLEVPVVRLTLESRNVQTSKLGQPEIDDLDKQWRAETKVADQPLITAVLASPLSSYLTRIQAGSSGLYTEVFVMDAKGLNAGQSSITSDYWQGDEAKFQKTFPVGADAVFVDEPEFEEKTKTWRRQVNLTLTDATGKALGAATVEVNVTELSRRQSANR